MGSKNEKGQIFIDSGGFFEGLTPEGEAVTIKLRNSKYVGISSIVEYSDGRCDICFSGTGNTLKNIDLGKIGYVTTYPSDTKKIESTPIETYEPSPEIFDISDSDTEL